MQDEEEAEVQDEVEAVMQDKVEGCKAAMLDEEYDAMQSH